MNGDVIPLLSESVQGVHARHYNYCSIGICYEGGINTKGTATDTRTEAQRHAMYELLKELTLEYPEARIMGHCELPHVIKKCPGFTASVFYSELQPENR